jgi:tetratricopeptide (TPR) repeat protein
MTTPTLPPRRSRRSPVRSPSPSPLRGSRESSARSWQLAPLLLALVVAPATARAGKKEDAKAHVAKATKAHQEGRFEAARVELEAAYALDPIPDLLYAIGQVYAKLGKCGDATTYFKRFAATQKDPQVAKVVDQAIAACKPAPEPAARPLPPERPMPADHPTPADSEPPPPARLTTTDRPAPLEGRPPPDRPTPVAPRPQPPAASKPAPESAQPKPPWYKDKLGDGLVLGGAVATVVGLVEYRSARADLDEAEDPTQTATLARYHDLVDSAHGKRAASVVFVGAGGALITAGIIHYLRHDRATEAHTVGIAPAHGGGVVTYEGRF